MKKLLMTLALGMFLILLAGQVSAWEWDNVKSYDQETKTAKISNALGLPELLGGGEIAKVQLKSEQNVLVGAGYQKVAEIEIESYSDYIEAIKNFEYYNLKKNNLAISKQVDLKYKTYEDVEIEDFKNVCNKEIEKNGTEILICSVEKIGTHFENKEVWKDLSSMDMKAEKLTIGIFTDVEVGEKTEWIYTFFGVRVPEFASWEQSLNVGLVSYYTMDNANYLDNVSGNHLTETASMNNVVGKIGNAINKTSTGANIRAINTTARNIPIASTNLNWSLSYWIYHISGTTNSLAISFGGNTASWGASNYGNYFGFDGGNIRYWSKGSVYKDFGTDIPTGRWAMMTWVYDNNAQNLSFYMNGTYKSSQSVTDEANETAFIIGNEVSNTIPNFIGLIDEVGLWNRTLTTTEITEQIYNNFNGNTYFLSSDSIPTITLNAPADETFTQVSLNTFNCTATDDIKVQNISFYLNNSINQTNSSVFNNTLTTFSVALSEGTYTWNCGACDNATTPQCVNGTARTFTLDTTPFIEFLTPPTLVNYANITQEYIPMKVNVSTNYFKNITFYLENINGTFFTQFYENETFDINFTDMPDGHYHYNVTICTTTDKCNTTETRHINHDVTLPVLTLNSPLSNYTTLSLPINVTLNFTATDDALSICWYGFNGTNTTFTCNTSTNISVNTSGAHSITYYANDTFGNLASGTAPFYIFYVQPSASATNPITEGGTSNHVLFVNMTDVKFYSPTAYLIWNGTNKGAGTLTNVSNDVARFDKSFIVPNINGTSVNWTWVYNLSTTPSVENWELSGNQTFISINLTECGAGTYVILNYTLYDQETKALASTDNASIEVDLTLTSQADDSLTWQFHTTKANSTNLSICLPSGALNSSSYNLDSIAKYSYQAHVVQYHYVVNFNLNSTTIPQTISLYDLATADSTSFLINYQDENYLYVENAIIDVWRRYIGDGVFFSVEHGKTDASGQTRLHLVTEDIIYKFLVWIDGELVYTSPEYLALCQATPCQINLRKTTEDTDGFSERDNVVYSYVFNDTTRTASFSFSTLDNTETEMNMTIYLSNQYLNDTACSTTLTTSGGQIDCLIPPAYSNTSYQTIILKDGEYFGTAFNSLAPKSMEIFGYTGIILTAIAYLMLALMGISSGIATIVLGITGLAIMGILQIFESGSIFGLTSAIIWLIVAGVIIIIKISKRRIQ